MKILIGIILFLTSTAKIEQINQSVDIIGNWEMDEYQPNLQLYLRVDRINPNKQGFIFKENKSLAIKSFSENSKLPTTQNGSFKINNDSILVMFFKQSETAIDIEESWKLKFINKDTIYLQLLNTKMN